MKFFLQNKIAGLGFFLFFGCLQTFSQTPETYFYDHEIDFSFPVITDWSMDIGAGYRGMLQERVAGEKISGTAHEHLEFNHFTNYKAKESLVLSLGLRYRFKEPFDASESNEFRIIEQIGIDPVHSSLPLSHRFRLEQRFKENTEHRIRYELEYLKVINAAFSVEVATEALYAVAASMKPEAEQRFTIGLENSSFEDLDLGLGLEFRLENYARNLAHEFFVMTGISLSL